MNISTFLLNNIDDAAEKFGQIEQLPQTIIVPDRSHIQINNYRALANAKAGNMEEFEKYFIEGAKGAKALGSKKRLQEAIDNLKAALERWPHEKRVTELLNVLR